ncbi:MAG: VWA domain-containing protein [Planctomycetaceae bacterium]|jgi:uncharacterized protein YegL|nr:VWA domain-containing protein [Planctomycetaceae bacterium]
MARLPVYLLIDVSASMEGKPIAAVNSGLQTMCAALRADAATSACAYVSLITFSRDAKVPFGLTELAKVNPPTLSIEGDTRLGLGLEKVVECANNEVVKRTRTQPNGDYKPLVFIFTDGQPNDDQTDRENAIDKFNNYHWGTVVGFAAGPNADHQVLKRLTENVVTLETTDAASIAQFFEIVSKTTSSAAANAGNAINILPAEPSKIG